APAARPVARRDMPPGRPSAPVPTQLPPVPAAPPPAAAAAPTVAPPATPTPAPGGTCGSYQIEREIGRGVLGVLFEAVHVPLQKRVALKVLHVRRGLDSGRLQRLFREAHAAAALHHSNLVPVFDCHQVGGTPYYA